MRQTTTRRRARLDAFVDVVDLDGKPQPLPPIPCEVEERHDCVVLRFDSDDLRVVRISHDRFNSLIGMRQAVYLSW
jgi:hypothetical protein